MSVLTEENTFEMLSIRDQKEKLLRYELIRLEGNYNMFDDRARQLTGLTRCEYTYIIKNYKELMKKFPDVKSKAKSRLIYIKSANIARKIALNGCDNCIENILNRLDIENLGLCKECMDLIK